MGSVSCKWTPGVTANFTSCPLGTLTVGVRGEGSGPLQICGSRSSSRLSVTVILRGRKHRGDKFWVMLGCRGESPAPGMRGLGCLTPCVPVVMG
jgi:hypothetical protein